MKKLLSLVYCLLTMFFGACNSNNPEHWGKTLGKFSRETSEIQTFKVDVKNFSPYPWRIISPCDDTDVEKYKEVNISIKVINTGIHPITTWQKTGVGAYNQKTIVIDPGKNEIIYEGTLFSFNGFDDKGFPYMSISMAKNIERLQCDIEVAITRVSKLNEPIYFGFTRSEPALWW